MMTWELCKIVACSRLSKGHPMQARDLHEEANLSQEKHGLSVVILLPMATRSEQGCSEQKLVDFLMSGWELTEEPERKTAESTCVNQKGDFRIQHKIFLLSWKFNTCLQRVYWYVYQHSDASLLCRRSGSFPVSTSVPGIQAPAYGAML